MDFRGVLGHEWVGVVEESPEPSWLGKRVVGEINVSCGVCPTCLSRLPGHCPHRTVTGILDRDGAFAEWLSLPLAQLHEVPPSVSDEEAVFTEPLAAACAILEQVHVSPRDRVVVLGAGRLGQLCARVLALTGASVTAVARSKGRLERLPPSMARCSPEEAGGLPLADVVVDCTGSASGLEMATRLVRPRGTIVLKTTLASPHTVSLAPWVIQEVTVVGSRCGPFEAALRWMEQGLVDPRPLVDEVFPLSQGIRALKRAEEAGVLKVLLDPSR